jgi:hypothetical protein
LRQSEAGFARNLFVATPTEAVRPPGFAYDANGVLQPIDYTGNAKLKGPRDAQKNGEAVKKIFDNQSSTGRKKGCMGGL